MLTLGKVTQHAKTLRLRRGITQHRSNSTLDLPPPPIQRSFSTLNANMPPIQSTDSLRKSSSSRSASPADAKNATKINYLKIQKLLEYSLELTKKQQKANNSLTSLSRYFKPKEKKDPAQSLYQRQIALEERQRTRAEIEHREQISQLKMIGRGTSIKSIQRNILSWYEPLTKVLIQERQDILQGVKAEDRIVSCYTTLFSFFFHSTFFSFLITSFL